MSLTLYQIFSDQAESSAAEALYSSQEASGNMSAESLVRFIVYHNHRASEHAAIAKQLQATVTGAAQADVKGINAAAAAQEAAASAHTAATAIYQLAQSGAHQAQTSATDSVQRRTAAQTNRREAQSLADAALLLRSAITGATADLQALLLSAAHADDHAAAVNRLAEEKNLAAAVIKPAHTTKPKPPNTKTPPGEPEGQGPTK